MSQFQKLTAEQKRIRSWRIKRNALVSKILRGNARITREEALQEANRQMRSK